MPIKYSKQLCKNFEDDNGNDTISKHSRNNFDNEDQKPAPAPTLSECIQAADIAQSRLTDRRKMKSKVNNRSVTTHLSGWLASSF
jgi:hypothetical protein